MTTKIKPPRSYGEWIRLFSALSREKSSKDGNSKDGFLQDLSSQDLPRRRGIPFQAEISRRDVLSLLTEIPWRDSRCEGVKAVWPSFAERLTETVNALVKRIAGRCTDGLNEALAEGDLSRMESIFRRCDRDWERCRFYRDIPFLPADFLQELDESVQRERLRYWTEMVDFLEEAADETKNGEIWDLYELARRIRRRIPATGFQVGASRTEGK